LKEQDDSTCVNETVGVFNYFNCILFKILVCTRNCLYYYEVFQNDWIRKVITEPLEICLQGTDEMCLL